MIILGSTPECVRDWIRSFVENLSVGVICAALTVTAYASSTCRSTPSDSVFQSAPSNVLNCGTTYQDGNCLPTFGTVNITRVVGSGLVPQNSNTDGTLVNPSAAVTNRIVSQFAYLQVKVEASLGPPGIGGTQVRVMFNAVEVFTPNTNGAYYPPNNGFGFVNYPEGPPVACFQIPISLVRFGTRVAGGAPQPGVNNIKIFADNPNATESCDDCSLLMNPGTLSFDAMAPIVLVHGWLGGPWNWESPTANPRVCPADPKNLSNGGPDFVQALKDANAPFDCSIQIRTQASTDEGATVLFNKLPAILSGFGTRHVHLIAHSKGGLYSREFLQKNAGSDPTAQIGVISLTTLETPHHGSVLSDTVVASREDPSVLPLIARINPIYYFLTKSGFFGVGNDDMTVSQVSQGFNQTYLQPPPQFMLIDTSSPPNIFYTTPFYYSTSSDADIDGDGNISAAEALPYSLPIVRNWMYHRLGTVRAINPGAQAGLWTPDPAPAGTFYKNDTAVTINSSQYLKFTELGPYVGASGRNHASIRNPDIAQTVLLNIRNAESNQPAQ